MQLNPGTALLQYEFYCICELKYFADLPTVESTSCQEQKGGNAAKAVTKVRFGSNGS